MCVGWHLGVCMEGVVVVGGEDAGVDECGRHVYHFVVCHVCLCVPENC